MKREVIAKMFEQTIGVEVEMNRITRAKAAQVAAKFFGTDNYHNTAHIDGYSTWSAWDAQGRKWKFSKDVSIAGPDAEKCELVTPILHYEDIELLQGLVRELRKAGARSDYARGCGVHVHIGADGHTAKSLRVLTNMMASHERLLASALDISWSRINSYCRTVDPRYLTEVNQKRPKTMEALEDIWYTSQMCDYGRHQHYNNSRYHMLNLHATFTKGTVEFRLFQFDKKRDGKMNGLHAGRLKAYIQLCLALNNAAKNTAYASWTEPEAAEENPKYVMRFWLKSLGCVGEEFKTLRNVMTEKLEGNSDCRTGDRANCNHRAA